jgi:drug/metabolite transporter, DME family
VTAVVAVLIAAALFGTTGTAQALGPEEATPITVGAARLVIGGLALFGLATVADRAGLRGLLRRPLAWAGAVGVLGYQLLFFTGTAQLGVAAGTLLALGSAPVLAGLLSWAVGLGRPSPGWAAATAVAVAGLVLLIGAAPVSSRLGFLAAVGAGACYALYTVAAKALVQAPDRPAPTTVMAAVFGIGVLPAAAILLLAQPAWLATPQGLAMALYLGLVPTAIGYLLFGRSLQALPAQTVATLTLAEPVVATMLAVLLLGESLTAVAVAGALLVLVALGLLGWTAMRRTPVGVQ